MVKSFKIFLVIFLGFLLIPATLFAEELVEMYQLRITNSLNGKIETSTNNGQTWLEIGKVTTPVIQTNNQGFTASKWGKAGTVVATAVNAIHIKTAQNNQEDKGVVFSILPSGQLAKTKNYNSYLDAASSLVTNLRPGTAIFGGEWSTIVGNPVYLVEENNLTPLPYNYTPKIGDILIIKVIRPKNYPSEIVFENRYGGIINLKYPNGSVMPVGEVLKPVYGIGRFIGTKDCDVGRIRANHNGVIDISTSPLGQVGGFQIIPAQHSESPEMADAKIKTQWMIIGPLTAMAPGNEGLSPFFSGYIMPRYDQTDLYQDNWLERLAERTLVEVQYTGKDEWQPMPRFSLDPNKPIPEEYNTVLKNIAKIRILLPVFRNN